MSLQYTIFRVASHPSIRLSFVISKHIFNAVDFWLISRCWTDSAGTHCDMRISRRRNMIRKQRKVVKMQLRKEELYHPSSSSRTVLHRSYCQTKQRISQTYLECESIRILSLTRGRQVDSKIAGFPDQINGCVTKHRRGKSEGRGTSYVQIIAVLRFTIAKHDTLWNNPHQYGIRIQIVVDRRAWWGITKLLGSFESWATINDIVT